nr:retrovirus-related Pol polyprotein from transposon TNT 1-94 [Tanacetum cinerariifolium]
MWKLRSSNSGQNRVILVREGVLAESSQSRESLVGVSCNTCGKSLDDMITERKEGSFKNAYSRLLGRGDFSNGGSSVSDSDWEFSSTVIAMNSSNSAKSFSSRMVPSMEWKISLHSSRRASKSSSKILKGLPKIRGTLLSSSISRITKSTGKVNLPTSTSIFSAIPIGYWNDRTANLTLILVGLRVSRDNFAYKKYGMRLMLAPRFARALHEKALLKLHGMRKLPGKVRMNFASSSRDMGSDFFEKSIEKRWEKESANESGLEFGKHHQADDFILGVSVFKHIAYSEEFVNVFVRIGFSSTIELISFDKSQVVTFNGKFICGFKNGDCETESQSDNRIDNPHGFIIHRIEIFKGNEKVTEVIDVENWRRHIRVSIWYLDSGCSRSMTGVMSYLPKDREQLGPKDHLGKFDAKADDGYFLEYSFLSKAFRVFNTRRQQVEKTYHVTFDESIEAIRFTNTSVDEIRVDDSSR